jgi:Ca2+-binding RTX toxin-like protein
MLLLPGRVGRVPLKAGVVMEALERRRLFSLSVHDGIITIVGTDAGDQIYIRGSNFIVNTSYGSVVREELLIFEPGSVVRAFDSTLIHGIRVEGGGGDDRLTIYDPGHDLCFPITLVGGAGNDTLTGHEFSDVLDGGGDNDVIYANPTGQIGQPSPEPALDDSIIRDGAGMAMAMARLVDGTLRITTLGTDSLVQFGTAGADGEQIYVLNRGFTKTFNASDVQSIIVGDGVGGGTIRVENRSDALIEVPITIIGGAGDDELLAQTDRNWHGKRIAWKGPRPFAPTVLIGGDGNDTLVSGIGDATMLGGSGDDHYTRGWGDDTIVDDDSPIPPPVIPAPDDGGGQTDEGGGSDGSDNPQPEPEDPMVTAVAPWTSAEVVPALDAAGLNQLVFGNQPVDIWETASEDLAA